MLIIEIFNTDLMKYSHFSFFFLFIFFVVGLTTIRAQEQVIDPVQWSAELKKGDTDSYVLSVTAETEPGWVIYSQFLSNDGPIPTTFGVDLPEEAQLIGGFEEPADGVYKMDEMFGMELLKFHGPATFVQKITSAASIEEINGTVFYMTCDDVKCLPPREVKFTAVLLN